MASVEQQECAALMRRLHRELRASVASHGTDAAWQRHVADHEHLREYAAAMHRLGQLWAQAPPPATNRIAWLEHQLQSYVTEGRRQQAERELAVATRLGLQLRTVTEITPPLRVLDVGSCYNPLAGSPLLNVLPIDLHPATPDVLQCDFLQVRIGDRLIIENNSIRQLDEASYDVVVFSLLLEYLPTSEQRLQCCKTAYDLLKYEGVLAIISPDSKHVGANAKIYKNWRYALSFLGFSRIVYEKSTFLHCMIFRKSLDSKIPERWAVLNEKPGMSKQMNIPQDFHDFDNKQKISEDHDPIEILELLNELPCLD